MHSEALDSDRGRKPDGGWIDWRSLARAPRRGKDKRARWPALAVYDTPSPSLVLISIHLKQMRPAQNNTGHDLELKSTTSVAFEINISTWNSHSTPLQNPSTHPRKPAQSKPEHPPRRPRGRVERSRPHHGPRSGQRGRTTSFPPRQPKTMSFRGAETLHSKTRAPPPCYRAVLQSLVSAAMSSEERGARNFRQDNDRHGAQAAVRPA